MADDADGLHRQIEALTAELDALSYSVAHDFRAPLRAIAGFSLALLEDYSGQLDAEGQRYLQRIRAGAQRMSLMIDGLVEVARLNRGPLVVDHVDLSSLARKLIEGLRATESGRVLDAQIADGLNVTGDPTLLELLLKALLENAWKFTRGRPTTKISFSQSRHGDELVFVIGDNGVGFDPTQANRLFVPFQRMHSAEEFEGLGLGLAMARRIVQRHGGRIWIEAALDAGVRISFTLPRGEEPG